MPEPVVAVYDSHEDAEQAVAKLSAASFDIKQVSIIGKDYHTEEKVVGYYTTGDRMKSWGGCLSHPWYRPRVDRRPFPGRAGWCVGVSRGGRRCLRPRRRSGEPGHSE